MKLRYPIILLCLLAAGAAFFLKDDLSAAQSANYLTAAVEKGDIEETVLASGTLKPSRLVAVGSQVSGRITALKVKLGDTVREGDLIAEIDSTTQDNALRKSKAALANVQAQRSEKVAELENARLTLSRQQTIFSKHVGSEADLQSAEADVKMVAAQIEALDAQIAEAEVAVETAKADVGYTRITAPMNGTVLAIVNQEGRTVNAIQSAPTIVILGDLTTMTVRAEISEADITRVKEGQPVRFSLIGDRTTAYDAVLASIEPAPESITSDSSVQTSTATSQTSASSSSSAIYYIGVFDVPNDDGRFRTYMSVEVSVVLGAAKGALTIPSSALGTAEGPGRYRVRVMAADGTLVERSVEIGLNNKITAEVRSGLEEGERVVISSAGTSASTAKSGRSGGPPPMGL